MRYSIPLSKQANQSLSVNLAGSLYDIAIHFTGSVMAVDISRDSVKVLSGARAVQNAPLLSNNEAENGNFTFLTENDEYPNWENFGGSCELIFSTNPADPLWTN